MNAVNNFLLIFDHDKNELVNVIEFGRDLAAATAAYSEMEDHYRDNPRMDIVLVGSDSLDTVKVTHSTYFNGTARALIGAALRSV